jgi:hypothetical protein
MLWKRLSFEAVLSNKGLAEFHLGELGFAVEKIQGKWYVNLR